MFESLGGYSASFGCESLLGRGQWSPNSYTYTTSGSGVVRHIITPVRGLLIRHTDVAAPFDFRINPAQVSNECNQQQIEPGVSPHAVRR